jgi:hypothetical protein
MKNSIKIEGCDKYELTMMVFPPCYFLANVLLWISSTVTGTISTAFCPSSISLSTTFLNHSSM